MPPRSSSFPPSPPSPVPAQLLALALSAAAAAALAPAGCSPSAPSPFGPDAGADAGSGGEGGEGGGGGAGPGEDPTLGGPCVDDGQCDDEIPCTFDACDASISRCRFTPDDMACQNGVHCDGVERCAPKLGCRPGEPVACSDEGPCTIDACDEANMACTHAPRDADLDGDPDAHCGGGDCDDTDPAVSSAQPEICGNGADDDCDDVPDEAGCVSPEHDTCVDPLEIDQPGTYAMSTEGAVLDYAASCGPPAHPTSGDVVAAIVLPPGPPVDVEVTARSGAVDVAVALAGQCGNAASEIACGAPYPAPQGGKIAKLRGRGLGDPAQPTAVPVYVTTAGPSPVLLDVAFLPPAPTPTNETCGTAAPITPGTPVEAVILDAAEDLGGACDTPLGELVYSFELAQAADVHVYAASMDGDGLPAVSLRTAACALPEDEITCQVAEDAHLFRHALPAGTYTLAVSASAPTTALVTVELAPPTAPPADESCAGAPPIAPNQTLDVSLAGHQDDVQLGCLPGAVDAAYALTLPVASDVLLVERISQSDLGAIQLAAPACAAPADLLACASWTPSPVRTAKYNVPAGEYRVVAESQYGQPTQVTAFVRPATPPTLVVFSDGCADALTIPPTGGRFQGTTANAAADFDAGCDQGGVPEGGAPDQLLRLELSAQKRVILDMAGSAYTTLLDVRKGPSCPGTEVLLGCAVGYGGKGSYLDLTLDAGVYHLQIDGLATASGPWFLDVRVVDP